MENNYLEPSVCGRPYLYSDSAVSSVSSRIVATLTTHLRQELLQQSLEEALVRFPQMAVCASSKGEEYVFAPAPGPLRIFSAADPAQPECFGDPDLGGYLFKVSWVHKTLYFDFHKAIADEYGMMTFVKAVLFRYFELSGYPVENDGTVKLLSGSYFPAEGSDPMERLADIPASRPVWFMDADAVRTSDNADGQDTVVSVRIPLAKIFNEYDEIVRRPVTYIAPVFSHAVFETLPTDMMDGKYVVASIQVNLRPYFPSASLRPFSTPVYLAYNRKLTDYPYNTVLMSQKKLLEAQLKTDALAYSAERTADLAEKAACGSSSLEDKKQQVRRMRSDYAARSTYSVCRVGNIILPDSMQRLVSEFYPVVPSGEQMFALSVVSFRGDIIVTVSGRKGTRGVAERFVELLGENKIDAYLCDETVYTPMHYHP